EPAARIPADGAVPEGAPDRVVETDYEEIEVLRRAGDGCDCLTRVIEHRLGVNLKPSVRIPADVAVPEDAPHTVIKADYEQVELRARAQARRHLLLCVVEHGLRMDREPATRVPADVAVPEGTPDRVVKADHEQIEIPWRA